MSDFKCCPKCNSDGIGYRRYKCGSLENSLGEWSTSHECLSRQLATCKKSLTVEQGRRKHLSSLLNDREKELRIERQQNAVLELALIGVAEWVGRNACTDGFGNVEANEQLLWLQHNILEKVLVEDDAYGWRAK